MIIRRRKIRIEIEQRTLRVEQRFVPAPVPPGKPEAACPEASDPETPVPDTPFTETPVPAALPSEEEP